MTAKNRIAKYLWTFIKYFSLILAGFIAFSVAGRLRDIDIVVTDMKPSDKWLKLFEEEGVECRYPESVR